MGKGFGIAALILAILAIFVPLVGIAVSGGAVVLALVAAFAGDRVLSTATALIALVDTFFLSPSITLVLHTSPAAPAVAGFLLLCGAAPIAVVIAKSIFEDQVPSRPPVAVSPEVVISRPPQADAHSNQQVPELIRQARQLPPHTRPPMREHAVTSYDRPAPDHRATSNPPAAIQLSTVQRVERMILIAFLCTYAIHLIAPPIAAFVPMASGEVYYGSRRFISLIAFSLITYAVFTGWFLRPLRYRDGLLWGSLFGATGITISFLMHLAGKLSRDISLAPTLDTISDSLLVDATFAFTQVKSIGAFFWPIPAMLVGAAKEHLMLRPRG